MKPVDQTVFGFPGGNCFSACVASLLELSIDDVPYFMHTDDDPKGEHWFDRFEAWLRPRGFWPLFLRFGSPNDEWAPSGWCILGGQSPRARPGREADDLHSVVGFGREIRHDPHPDRRGLVTVTDCLMLVPFDPVVAYARGVEDGRRQVVEENPVRCNRCLKPVPLERYCYAVPMCYGCLEPTPPLEIIEMAPPTDNGEADHPCFEPGEPSDCGTCDGDGWFRCLECEKLHPNTRAFRTEDDR